MTAFRPHDDDLLPQRFEWERDADQGFWSYVDSQSVTRPPRCDCTEFEVANCRVWAHRREGIWCIASRSDHTRCARAASITSPFCDFHLERAWKAFMVAAGAERAEMFREMYRLDQDNAAVRAAVDQGQRLDVTVLRSRVYFFVVGDFVKIGKSMRPHVRVKSLAASTHPPEIDPREGQLLGTIPGDSATEHTLHDFFRAHRVDGEWFAYGPIRKQIEHLLADEPEPMARTG